MVVVFGVGMAILFSRFFIFLMQVASICSIERVLFVVSAVPKEDCCIGFWLVLMLDNKPLLSCFSSVHHLQLIDEKNGCHQAIHAFVQKMKLARQAGVVVGGATIMTSCTGSILRDIRNHDNLVRMTSCSLRYDESTRTRTQR